MGNSRDKANARLPGDDSAGAAPADDGARATAGWVRPALTAARRWGLGPRRLVASALAAGLLAAGAWYGTGAVVESDARQRVADRWAELRGCLLGNGLPPGARPSQLLRAIELSATLTADGSTWPGHCIPYANQLDQALASPTVQRELGALPLATPLFSGGPLSGRGAELDALHAALEAARLPHARGNRAVPQPPPPAQATLRGRELAALATAADLRSIEARLDPHGGKVLRLILPGEPPQICRFNDGPREQRWRTAACRSLPRSMMGGAVPRLARSEPGSADLVYQRDASGKDGFFDAASGLRIWRPRDPQAQAVVRKSGIMTVLYAEHRSDGADREVTAHRLVQLRPGRAPSNQRLSVPKDAERLLLPQGLLWWPAAGKASQTTLYGQALLDGGSDNAQRWLDRRKALGRLPAGSRYVADCASGYSQAVLFAAAGAERRHSLLFREQGMFHSLVDVGALAGAPTLSCHGDVATVVRRRNERVARIACTVDGCQQAVTGPLPGFAEGLAAVAPLGSKLVLVWSRPGEPVRLRVGAPDGLHQAPDELLIDDGSHDGLEPAAFRLVSNDGVALLFIQDRDGTTYPLRIGAAGQAEPVKVVDW